MIEPEQAENIVRDCINKTVDTDEEYSADKPLGLLGIIAPETLSTLKLRVRKDEVGVKAYNHTLAASELESVTPDTLAGGVEEIIIDKAVPVQEMDMALAQSFKKKSKKKKWGKFLCQIKINIYS